MEEPPLSRKLFKLLGIVPCNKKIFIPITIIYILLIFATLHFLIPNFFDLILSSQSIFLLFIALSFISDHFNYMLFGQDLFELFESIENMIGKCTVLNVNNENVLQHNSFRFNVE